jgi:hypothetical protein
MEHLFAAISLRIRSAVVSEPTSLRPGIVGKGSGLARVTIQGLEAHSAYPYEGLSAIFLAARFISRIEIHTPQLANPSQPIGPARSSPPFKLFLPTCVRKNHVPVFALSSSAPSRASRLHRMASALNSSVWKQSPPTRASRPDRPPASASAPRQAAWRKSLKRSS